MCNVCMYSSLSIAASLFKLEINSASSLLVFSMSMDAHFVDYLIMYAYVCTYEVGLHPTPYYVYV